jgi:hypothetical protein
VLCKQPIMGSADNAELWASSVGLEITYLNLFTHWLFFLFICLSIYIYIYVFIYQHRESVHVYLSGILKVKERGLRKSNGGVNLIKCVIFMYGNITMKSLCTTNTCY